MRRQVANDFFGGGHDGAVSAGQVEGSGLLKGRSVNLAGGAGDGEPRTGQGAGGGVGGGPLDGAGLAFVGEGLESA